MSETGLDHQTAVLRSGDGHDIRVLTWVPAGGPAAVIQILHGLGEHAARYERFALEAVNHGYAVYAHDHRGHGPESTHLGHFGDERGWPAIVGDVRTVNAFITDSNPCLPVVLLGHSMGSFIAQDYAMQYGDELAGMILSGSTWSSKIQLYASYLIAKIECWRHGVRGVSELLYNLTFSAFNKPFRPARTELDWLSRDENEVDKYIADPLCGGPYSSGLWLDFARGLLHISRDSELSRIPATLPILITGGALDVVGGDKGMGRLLQHYARTGHQRLKARIYPDGRHEMLNEINRDEVTRDWLEWMNATTGIGRSD